LYDVLFEYCVIIVWLLC